MSKPRPLYGKVKLNCAVISDTHIDIKHPTPKLPMFFLRKALTDSQKSAVPTDALVIVGDVTSRGSDDNWGLTLKSFKGTRPADKILLAVGNHDLWSDEGYPGAFERFSKYSEAITGMKLEKPYFSTVLKGYHFIFLGGDSDAGCDAEISEEQIEWFKGEMKAAGESGLPIFVFCHQSLNQKHGLPVTSDRNPLPPDTDPAEGGIGKRSDEIESVLKSYKNVYFFSGHSHMGIGGEDCFKKNGYSSFEREGELRLINLPSLACGNHHGDHRAMCTGLRLEVYDNKVVLRPRSFLKGSWLRKLNIKDGKPYYEDTI